MNTKNNWNAECVYMILAEKQMQHKIYMNT